MIFFLTTPTRAYEAYNISALNVLQQQVIIKQEQNFTPTNENVLVADETKPEMADARLCAFYAERAENTYNIKPNLLQTIASVESGRYNEDLGRRVAWPWTVHANGQGRYYATKAEAVNAVKSLQAQGITNIDVGCMQINLKYHGKAFSSIEEAFNPEQNVGYSAKFLLNLYKHNGNSWSKTAMQYHSKNYAKGLNYKNKLEKHYAEFIRPSSLQTLF